MPPVSKPRLAAEEKGGYRGERAGLGKWLWRLAFLLSSVWVFRYLDRIKASSQGGVRNVMMIILFCFLGPVVCLRPRIPARARTGRGQRARKRHPFFGLLHPVQPHLDIPANPFLTKHRVTQPSRGRMDLQQCGRGDGRDVHHPLLDHRVSFHLPDALECGRPHGLAHRGRLLQYPAGRAVGIQCGFVGDGGVQARERASSAEGYGEAV